jgi:diaminopimelate decarboxylase
VALAPERAAKDLASAVTAECASLGTAAPRISIEPGRAVVAPTTLTLYTVGTVKPVTTDDGTVRTYVSVDGGMSDNLRPALYGARYTAAVVSREATGPTVTARVVGKHCESGDVVVHDVELPADIAAGDLLAVPVTGAYGRSMASNYNLVTRPPVVAVAVGRTHVLVRRETEEDLLALDQG